MDFLVSGTAIAIVTAIVELIKFIAGGGAKKYKDCEQRLIKNNDDLDVIKSSQRTILHDRIKQLAQSYKAAGTVTFNDRKDLFEMYEIYKEKLGGNGSLALLIDEVKKLPCEG